MVISYAICSHNETDYLYDLLNQLIRAKPYEIVILDDFSSDDLLAAYFMKIKQENSFVKIKYHPHNGNFSEQKNLLTECCSGDWIVNLDADEFITDELIANIPVVLEENPEVEAYWMPRVNIVKGMTDEHIQMYGWKITELMGQKLINWPDPQMRIYKRSPEIRWVGKVHERLTGFKKFGAFPMELPYAICHYKTIDRQMKQNEMYSTLIKG